MLFANGSVARRTFLSDFQAPGDRYAPHGGLVELDEHGPLQQRRRSIAV